ncbi:hypothetical protein AXF42_Ash012626 [Apostasia shenzhenica]|uniref:Uncharacterized protein n=1 Tax=Apostasia shenzhenica TaxID=1088818 RepID=A0A2H9ZT82_9ASPA|nr:hypothetical protein AXF42_Ash012626 [Apostasia shenzhenica]
MRLRLRCRGANLCAPSAVGFGEKEGGCQMQQRRSSVGRPSGTDGSDFSYRMVVDSRYTKVAKGRSRLKVLLSVQCFFQAVGFFIALASQEKGFNNLAVVSISVGFVSLLIGELGRRRSQANLLRIYLSLSSIAIACAVAHTVRSDLSLKVSQYKDLLPLTAYEFGMAVCVLIGVLLQIFVIITTVTLAQNMSSKRTS